MEEPPALEEPLAVGPWEDATWVPETRRVKVATPGGQSLKEITFYKNPLGMEFVLVQPGEFAMGRSLSLDDMPSRYRPNPKYASRELPQHQVRITRSFYVSTTEVTVEQYQAFLRNTDETWTVNWTNEGCPLREDETYSLSGNIFGQDPEQPMIVVSWYGARRFCEWLSLKSGRRARLPTEAEWEYACRAGTSTLFYTGDTISTELANYPEVPAGNGTEGVYRGRTTVVGSFPANPWGLYDMHGNVSEWCADWYAKYYYQNSPVEDPRGPEDGLDRVVRGGGWDYLPTSCRSAARSMGRPAEASALDGFRVVISAEP